LLASDALESDGSAARIRGTQNAALLGAGQYAMSVSIDVPEPDAPRAEELLRALFRDPDIGPDEEPEDEADAPPIAAEATDSLPRPDAAAADQYRPPRRVDAGPKARFDRDPRTTNGAERRSRAAALGLALVFPGFGQVYVRRGYVGGCVLLGHGLTIAVAVLLRSLPHLGLAIAFSMIVDAVGGQIGVGALARGDRMQPGRQWALGIAEVALIQAAAGFVAFSTTLR
jgi:hypothetical protein